MLSGEILWYIGEGTRVRWNRQSFDEMYLHRNILIGELHRVRGGGAVGLQYLEEFLQLDHQLPVGLDEVVAEVILARVDTGTGYLEQHRFAQ